MAWEGNYTAEIVLKDIHKYYGTQHVLKGVSFEIFEDTVVGLIGKMERETTLFKIISGAEGYDKGELQMARGRRVEYWIRYLNISHTTVYQVLIQHFAMYTN